MYSTLQSYKASGARTLVTRQASAVKGFDPETLNRKPYGSLQVSLLQHVLV